ncbi:Titin [Rhizoctonia solani]|uniref:Titin n=1 Tax=Rhizoctonia solani TaxID=456999 RepID=A0A0K6FM98_9AGAM|nr:Titin [Rhizoctonia solani]
MTNTTSINSGISDILLDQLRAAVKGAVYRREDSGFVRHSQLFNAVICSPAKLLVRPLDAYDVSEVVKFCNKHGLSPSAKSGGYGTHGWAVEGDVIIDMRLISQIKIERPGQATPDWESMRESPHVRVTDPDTLRGSTRLPSAASFPMAYPTDTIGPPPIHDPFTESRRRSANEAFHNIMVTPASMQVDGEDPVREIDADRPTRRLRVSSPASAQASRSSADLNTPPTTDSPRTPAEGINVKPPTPPHKSHGPATPGEVARDETLLPPTADRPVVGFDMRGFVGRDPGYWDAVWTQEVSEGVAVESAGATALLGATVSSGLPAFPSISSPPLDTPLLRSTAPASARPFDFTEPVTSQINAHSNPHGNPTGNSSALFPGLATPDATGRPFQFGQSEIDTPALDSPQPDGPTVTHVPYEPRAPVPYTYVTFGAGASQKDVNAFCASHPLETVAPNSPRDGQNVLVADTARPNLDPRPASSMRNSYFGNPAGGSLFGASDTVPYYVPFAAHPVGSSVMLLGGFGFQSRLRGLSMDCLVEAEVVLADGRIVWVSASGVKDQDGNQVEFDEEELDADAKEFIESEKERAKRLKEKSREQDSDPVETPFKGEQPQQTVGTSDRAQSVEPDEESTSRRGLWWALRGAGSAFGIVVRYKTKAFPVPVVFAGNLIYNFNKATAASLIMHFRDCIKSAPRELYANCILTAGPRNQGALVVIQICYSGPRAEGLPFLQAISSWEGDTCLLNEVQEKEFVWQQDSIAKVLKGGSGRKWFIRSNLIASLTDEIIYRTVRKFGDTPDGCTWLFELSGGALVDTTDSCLPKAAREAAFTIVALHQWKLEMDDPACVLTAEEWIKETLALQSTGGPFPCFLERREKRSRILGVYGAENWARLCALKKKYDPDGIFRHNFWPLDEHGKPIVDPKEMRSGADLPGGHRMDSTLDERGVPIGA